MDKKKFELKMKNFFEKAGVTLLKKGVDYLGGEETSSYILLDSKRKSFYLTETDVFDINDTELDGIAEHFITNYDISEIPAKTMLRLGRASVFFDDDFTVEGVDFTPMIRKSAFVISEPNADDVGKFLKKHSVNFQSVPFKGEFLVMFMDRSNSKKIATLYRKVSDEFIKSSSGVPGGVREEVVQLEDEIDRTIRENKILFDIDRSDDIMLNHKSLQKEAAHEDPSAGLLSEISVSLNELSVAVDLEADKSSLALSEKEKTALNIAAQGEDAFKENSFISGAKKLLTEKPKTSALSGNTDKTKQLFKPSGSIFDRFKDEKNDQNGSKEELFYKILTNISAILFCFPAYILNKLTFKKVFPFAIYWIAAIVVFFGFYQIILSYFCGTFYETVITSAKNTAIYASGLLTDTKGAVSLAEASGNIMNSALVYFMGELSAYNWMKDGLILQYFLAFSALLMIFPLTRSSGAKLSVFFVLLYICLPSVIFMQLEIIKGAVDGTLPAVKFAIESDKGVFVFGVVASAVAFATYIVPIISIIVLYVASGFLNPYKKENNNKEVLP